MSDTADMFDWHGEVKRAVVVIEYDDGWCDVHDYMKPRVVGTHEIEDARPVMAPGKEWLVSSYLLSVRIVAHRLSVRRTREWRTVELDDIPEDLRRPREGS